MFRTTKLANVNVYTSASSQRLGVKSLILPEAMVKAKGGGKSPKGPKGGSKRSISKVKRSNQKQNKLVKQGKARPNSKPKFISNQRKEKSGLGPGRDQKEEQEQWMKKKEQDHDEALQELADEITGKDAAFIIDVKGKKGKKRRAEDSEDEEADESDEEALGALERGAMKRIETERGQEKKLRGLLPIKTKDGMKQRVEEVEASEDEDDEEEESGLGMEEDDEEEEDDDDITVKEEVSVVELYARRKELLTEKKIHIGSLASNYLEAPQERMINLEKLVKLVDSDQPIVIEMTVHRLAAASVLEILKDVTPGFKIVHQEARVNEKLKKDTLKLQKFEQSLLKCYKNYLLKLEKLVNQLKGREVLNKARQVNCCICPTLHLYLPLVVFAQFYICICQAQTVFFLDCMCQLLTNHPHFNFATNILHAVVPLLSSSNLEARAIVKKSIEEVFRGDLRGEISMEATRLINHLVKTRKHNVRNDVVDVLLALRIKNVNLDKEKEEEIEMKKKEARIKKIASKAKDSKQEKKRKKKLEGLEKEMLEAKGEEGKKVKDRYFTETTKLVFTIYFRILKSFPKSKLMGSVLEGLSRFAHVINIEFFSDLVTVFKELLSSGHLGLRDTLLATSTVFAILSGQGESLNIDPTSFYQGLYSSLFSISLSSCTASTTSLAVRALHDMLVKRKKKVSKARVLAFTKRLGTLSLQLEQGGAAGALSCLRALHTAHPVCAQLLDPEHEVGSGLFDPTLPDPEHCSASNTTSWELSLVSCHYHPMVAKLAEHVVAGCPSTGEKSLPQELKLKETEMVTEFSGEQMAFNPPVQPPAKKAKKKARGCPVSPEYLKEDAVSTEDPDLVDFHAVLLGKPTQTQSIII